MRLHCHDRHPALALWTLGVLGLAWPVLGLLRRYPEFFHVRQSSAGEVVALVSLLCLVLPLALVALHRAAARVHAGSGRVLFVVLVLALWLLVVLSMTADAQVLSVAMRGAFALIAAVGLAGVCLFTASGSTFLRFLSPAIIVVPVLFLLSPGIRPLLAPAQDLGPVAQPAAGSAIPIVWVVFDELPSNALLDAEGGINRAWFPGFAALAEASNWYPNATTVAASTVLALPAMLTGRYPQEFKQPHGGEYPDNLFSWLADSHAMNVEEAVTALCPVKVCGARRSLPAGQGLKLLLADVAAVYLNITVAPWLPGLVPPVNQSWSGFWVGDEASPGMYTDRLAQLHDWSRGITHRQGPGLDFIHLTFPHIPYEFLPGGQRYTNGWLLPGLDTPTQSWAGSDWQSRQALQRFVLQLQALDTWLAGLLETLRREGRFDETLLVVTADHGVSFLPGANRRDAPPVDNLERNILPVPLFIKLPLQQRGEVLPRNAQTIDILPTIAQVLSRPLPWATDGVSLLAEPQDPGKQAWYRYREMVVHQGDVARTAEALQGGWQRQALLDLARAGGPWSLASADGWLGQAIEAFPIIAEAGLELAIDHAERFRDLDPQAERVLPLFVTGHAAWPGQDNFHVLIAVDGVVAAVVEARDQAFAALLPPQVLREGNPQVRAFGVQGPAQPGAALHAAPGERPVEHWTWDPKDLRLERNGQALEFDPEGLAGALGTVLDGPEALEVLGWAIDARNAQAVDKVLLFADSKLLDQVDTLMLHHRTHDYGVVINVGFHAVIPHVQTGRHRAEALTVIAVSRDGRALRLELSAESPQ